MKKWMRAIADYKDNYIVVCLLFYIFDIITTLHNFAVSVGFIVTEIQYSLMDEHHIEFIMYRPLPYLLNCLLILSILYHLIILITSSIKSNGWKLLSISVVLMSITEFAVEATRYFVDGRPLITYYTFEVLVLFVFHVITILHKKEWWNNWSLLHPKYPYIFMAKLIASKEKHKA